MTPSSVRQMALTLEERVLIERVPGRPRSTRALLTLEELPVPGLGD